MAEQKMSSTTSSSPPEPAPSGDSGTDARVWNSLELLGESREVLIQHGDELYRLRITRHGKLILYK